MRSIRNFTVTSCANKSSTGINMAAQKSITKSALWSLAIFAILSLQSADAQNCTDNSVPGWGIAIITMVALLLLGMLFSCCIVPLLCKKGGDGCQSGCMGR